MKKKLISALLSTALVFSCVSAPVSAQGTKTARNLTKVQSFVKDPAKVKAIQKLDKLSGGKLSFSENAGGEIFIAGKLSGRLTAGEKAAAGFLNENKAIFGISSAADELENVETIKDKLGDTYVKYVQTINGIKVEGSSINVHFDKNGVIISVNGKLTKNKNVTTLGSTDISTEDAVKIAEKQFIYQSLRNVPDAEKLILSKDNKNYEVYKVNISYKEPSIGNYDVYIETHSGKVINTENNIRYDGPTTGSGVDVLNRTKSLNLYLQSGVYYMYDLTNPAADEIVTATLNHQTGGSDIPIVSNTSNYFNSEDYKASVSAHYNAKVVVDFYKNEFSRNSLDNNNMNIASFTHYGTNVNNAFWDGYEMVYGDGDGVNYTYLSGDLTIVGHEMTHGVVTNTANLAYHNQSGALNESIADVFGVLINTYDKYNVASGKAWTFNASDWVVGADVYTPAISGDATRSLANPTLYDQPDNMSDYQNLPDTEEGDNGGVHINSGIPSKAAFLIAQSIGMEKTAKIYYRALTNYMSENTDFQGEENCLVEAATDLYGSTSAEVTAITNAFQSVGIGGQINPGNDPYEPNDTPETAYPINFGTTYQSYISSESDFDAYKLNVDSATGVNIKLFNLPKDYDLELYDADLNIVAYSYTDGTGDETINYSVKTPGIYYVLVYSYYSDYDTNNMYSLLATKSEPQGLQVVSLIGSDRYDTAVKLSQSKFNTADTVFIVNGNAMADGLGATPLAAYLQSPILLTGTNSLPKTTEDEITRLGAQNAVIIGGTGVVSKNVENELVGLGIQSENILRIGGKDRYDTSLQIAQIIDDFCYKVSNVVIANGLGEADALSISAAAGMYGMPIVLVQKDSIPQATYSWLSSANLDSAFIIGGTEVVSNNVMNKINGITVQDISNNRLGGHDRYITNALVIDRFYGNSLNKVYIAKGTLLVDALASGPIAAMNQAPVVLAGTDLNADQKSVLSERTASTIVRTGGGISDKAVNSLITCLQ